MRKTHVTTISLPPQLAKRAQKFMQREGRTRSELFRDALRRYLADEEEENLLKKEMQVKAKKLGIKNEQDVADLLDALRT